MNRRQTSTRFIITISAALCDWAIIAAAIFISESVNSIMASVAAVIVIGSRQHALGVIAHEAIHWPTGYLQRAAILTCKYVCAWPILMHFDLFREIHLAHHRHLNTDADPDFVRNRPQDLPAANSLWQILRYGLGMNRLKESEGNRAPSGLLKFNSAMVLFWCLALALMGIFNSMHLFLVYWALPLFSWFIVLNRLRGILEHTAVGTSVVEPTRSTRGNIFSNFLFLPHGIGLHGEHHSSPQTPFYRLGKIQCEVNRWRTSNGVLAAAWEVFASTSWFRLRFGQRRSS